MAPTAIANPRVRIIDPPSFTSPYEELRQQIRLLLEENEELKARLTALENQANSPGWTRPGKSQDQSSQDEEAWLRQDPAWLDESCPFQKATGRTWRQLAENQGGKIPMNGKGAQVPRAYLHSIENWTKAYQPNRLKAKLALELCKG